ncbi:asparagine synthase (glutamine-hydrolyzing) [Nitratifractor sp.]|uniref:asparagine synthase (glutamine-hydrolyzing) n=1 Tax=Nitratifractor sp. TaxID=2268144 RepID=UPI0025FD0311|nr:asparagine synthase (glutamine-hydrolyzing) [Nitratifractor sp.]
MLTSISHRGPDDSGIYEDECVSFGHVRLSILDLSSHGHQPMAYDNLVMVYNGEVYNFREIKKELEALGYRFESSTDSEVVLKAWHCWGEEALHKFHGMFAFTIYDKTKRRLTLCRDRVGVKPLYYIDTPENFAFASELRALMPISRKRIDRLALAQFFTLGYITDDLAIFDDVKKLPPGHLLRYDLEKRESELVRYWRIEEHFHPGQKSEKELINELEERLIEGIKLRMVSDAPVGVFLSGGTDSSLVSAILQKHYGQIHTFTIGFAEAGYDESGYAAAVAKHLGTRHTQKILGAQQAKEILEHFVEIYDEPFGDSSGIPTYLVSQVAKENGVKVVLSADGGDELFCGYERYWFTHRLGRKFHKLPLRKTMASLVGRCEPCLMRIPIKNMEHKLGFLQKILRSDDWFAIYRTILSNYRDDIAELGLPAAAFDRAPFDFGEKIHPMQGMMLWDFYNYLPHDILVKVDRATMANSIEGREPLLDHGIIEYAASIPFEYKYRNGESKYILKKVLERYLPKELVYRKKMGFGIPMFEWFRNDLVDLFDRYFTDDEIIDMRYPRKMLARFKAGEYVNVNKLWFVLIYKMWRERYLA